MTINEKREACIEYETAWLMDCNDGDILEDIIRRGWKGWENMSDESVEKFYKDHIAEE